MLYAVVIHSVAGTIAGSFFKAPTLLLILAVVLTESALLIVHGSELGTVWGLANITSIQAGYFAGICLRAILEQAGYLLPPANVRL